MIPLRPRRVLLDTNAVGSLYEPRHATMREAIVGSRWAVTAGVDEISLEEDVLRRWARSKH